MIGILLAFAIAATTALADGGILRPDLKTDEVALHQWAEMRFGTMFHWGPSVLHNINGGDNEISWSMTNRAEYETCYQHFEPTNFNADQWADFVTTAGMKYAIIVCKHHDGFCMWDTATTSNNVMNTPFHTDVTRAFLDACRKRGLLAGTYFSVADLHFQNCDSMDEQEALMEKHPELNQALLEYAEKQCAELIDKYGSRLFWFDGFWHNGWDAKMASELYAYLKAKAPDSLLSRVLVRPLVNGHWIPWNTASVVGDFNIIEGRVGPYTDDYWEMVTSISYPLYTWNDHPKYKSVQECIQTLASCASRNGNLLLCFFPDADGAIPQEQWAIARQIGAWLKINGEGIYGTHAGPWYPSSWGGSTHKGNEVFVHVFPKAPEDLQLPPCEARVAKARLLNGLPMEWKQDDMGALALSVPQTSRDPNDTVVELTMDRPFSGMVKEREALSMFEGNAAYGKIVSANATLTVSSHDKWDNPAKYPSFFTGERPTSGFAFQTHAEPNPWAIVDLGCSKRITGLVIENRSDMNQELAATLHVSISNDGQTWKQVWVAECAKTRWEIPLTDFHNHDSYTQGELARYLKLETKPNPSSSLHLRRIEVYGFELKKDG